MNEKRFSKSEAIKYGWNTTISNIGFFIVLMIIVGLVYYIPDFISEMVKDGGSTFSFIINMLSLFLGTLISMGLIKIAIKYVDNEKGAFIDLFSCYPLFIKYFLASFLYGLIVFGGTLLLIFPGIIWSIKFQFYSYFIIDRDMGITESLKESAKLTNGVKWDLFLFALLIALINFAGLLCFVIGLFITLPTTMIALAYVYRKLLRQIEVSEDIKNEVSP